MAVLIITLAGSFLGCLPFIAVELDDWLDARRFEREMLED